MKATEDGVENNRVTHINGGHRSCDNRLGSIVNANRDQYFAKAFWLMLTMAIFGSIQGVNRDGSVIRSVIFR